MVEQQRPLRRPGSRSEGLEHDRCKDLHPVGEQLAMTRLAQLAGLSIAPEAPRHYQFVARGITQALQAAGTGSTYMRASRATRDRARRSRRDTETAVPHESREGPSNAEWLAIYA